MEKMLLTNPEILPDRNVLERALHDAFPVLDTLFAELEKPDVGFTHEWRYYHDGKAWLCKVQFRKKTVFWLSVWESHFRTTFYFSEKQLMNLVERTIAPSVIPPLDEIRPAGKSFPISLNVNSMKQIEDILWLVEYKKGVLYPGSRKRPI